MRGEGVEGEVERGGGSEWESGVGGGRVGVSGRGEGVDEAGREVSNHSHLVLSKGQPPSGGPTHSGYLSREHVCVEGRAQSS